MMQGTSERFFAETVPVRPCVSQVKVPRLVDLFAGSDRMAALHCQNAETFIFQHNPFRKLR